MSATDANRFALRFARQITGRPKVLVFNWCYHGTVDETFAVLGRRRVGRGPSRQRRAPGRSGGHHRRRRVQRPRRARAGAGHRRGGVRAGRAGAHQHRHRPARPRLPRRPAPPHPRDRHAADHRRDPHAVRRAGRLHRRARARAGHADPRQADRRWRAGRGLRLHPRGGRGHRRADHHQRRRRRQRGRRHAVGQRPGPGRHPGHARRGAHRRRLRHHDPAGRALDRRRGRGHRPARPGVDRAAAGLSGRVLVLPAAPRRGRGRGRHRPRPRRPHAPLRAQPRRPAHPVPQHGADVAGHHRRRRRPPHRPCSPTRSPSSWPDPPASAPCHRFGLEPEPRLGAPSGCTRAETRRCDRGVGAPRSVGVGVSCRGVGRLVVRPGRVGGPGGRWDFGRGGVGCGACRRTGWSR